MTDLIFDVALEKRFVESGEIATIDVASADTLLIRDSATGVIMRLPFSTLSAAISTAFGSSFASLVDGKVPASQLPSYVDDVLEYANTGAFPATGETGKIYVALDTNKTYRWSGSGYVEISASPGSTDAVAEGATNLYFTNARASAAAPVQSVAGRTGAVTLSKSDVGLSNVNNTADADKPVSTAQQTALDAKANVSQEVWTAFALAGAWVNYGTPFATAAYFKDTLGFVHLKGLIKDGSGTIATLPVGYRPSEQLTFIVNTAGGAGEVFINSSGGVLKQGGANSYFSLDGISFKAA